VSPNATFDLYQAATSRFSDNRHEQEHPHHAQPVTVPKPSRPAEDFLASVPLFRELPKADIQRIAIRTRAIDAPRGTVLLRRGDPCCGFHVIVFGHVKLVLQSPQGSEKVAALMGPGQSFGEALMFIDAPYLVTAETVDDAKLLHVDREIVFAEIDRDPRFARCMLAGLSGRLHQLMIDVESYTLHSGTQRVIGYLLRDSSTNGTLNATTINLEATKGVIASRLNITKEHFSRILHQLTEKGLIEVSGRDIRIPDIERLRTREAC
jgi:CRP-like cAMP-binding protein